MTRMNKEGTLAVREHILLGHPVTRLDAIILFGVSNLTMAVSKMRQEGWQIKSCRVPYARALVRLNSLLKPKSIEVPDNLPVREILLTEYRLSR